MQSHCVRRPRRSYKCRKSIYNFCSNLECNWPGPPQARKFSRFQPFEYAENNVFFVRFIGWSCRELTAWTIQKISMRFYDKVPYVSISKIFQWSDKNIFVFGKDFVFEDWKSLKWHVFDRNCLCTSILGVLKVIFTRKVMWTNNSKLSAKDRPASHSIVMVWSW